MPVSATTLKKLMDAGVTGEILLDIISSIDADHAVAAPPEKKRSSAAERQARYRERKASQTVTHDVTVTHNSDVTPPPTLSPKKVSPTPPSKNNPLPDPHSPSDEGSLAPQAASKAKKGTRLPSDWVLPRQWGQWAVESFSGISIEFIRSQAEQFRDYWVSKTGAGATKLDWEATWRNWMRTAFDRQRTKTSRPMTRMEELRADLKTRIENAGTDQGSSNSEPVRRLSFLGQSGE